MECDIPRSSGDPLRIALDAGDRLFVVGANGSGKSALLQHFVMENAEAKIRRVSAHRQTWLGSASIHFTPHHRKEFERTLPRLEAQVGSRWMDFNPDERQSAVLFDLIAKDNARARSIAQHIDEKNPEKAIKHAAKTESTFDQLNDLLALATLTVSLENANDEEILARHGMDATSFSIAEMSDGERNATIIAATVLTVEPNTVLLIDEPERHLHRAIIEPFLSALFARRKDCAFVVSTHEIALPLANQNAAVLVLRSCEWAGDRAKAWDATLLTAKQDLPEELKRAILGARRRVLFVEGTSNSLDLPIYDALFQDISVVPQESCRSVQQAVKGIRETYSQHDLEAFGLIDADGRPEEQIKVLAESGVFALSVYSAEALYYCHEAVEAVARRQAESFEDDPTVMRQRLNGMRSSFYRKTVLQREWLRGVAKGG